MAKGAGGSRRPAAASSASTATPSHSVSSLLHLVTQWMSTVTLVRGSAWNSSQDHFARREPPCWSAKLQSDRKSTRLNSSHANISYAVFCLKKKKIKTHR